MTITGIAEPILTPAIDVAGGKAMRLDLGPLNLSGPKTVTVKARNMWGGESASSAPLTFIAGPAAAPSGITLSVN